MNRRRFVQAGMCALALPAHAEPPRLPQRREFVAPHMGTLWRLVFFEDDAAKAQAARRAAWARLEELNARLSDYAEDSELNRLCRERRLEAPSEDLRRVLTASQRIAEESGGLFDATIGPLVRLWRAARKEGKLPAPEAIADAKKRVGWQALEIGPREIRFHIKGGQLDLGGIGKGFAQDEVLRLLRERHGITSALIDAGGGVSVSGPPPGSAGWRAGVIAASAEDAAPETTLLLKDLSLATSGDLHQFVEIGGVRYSHIIDPRTGLGQTRRAQASVAGPDGAIADALTKPCCLLEESEARALLQKHPDAAARVATEADGGPPRVWQTDSFRALRKS